MEVLRERYQEDGLDAFPPVVLYRDADDVHWLADGHYRVQAVADALGIEGQRTIRADIRHGSKRDAIYYAAEANAKHGTPLSRQEKRRVVIRLLQDDEWSQQMSDSAIARHVGVSNGFVSTIHRELDSQRASLHDAKVASETRTVKYQRGGKEVRMKKGNIGRSRGSQAKTAPPTPEEPATLAVPQPNGGDHAAPLQEIIPKEIAAEVDELAKAWLAATFAQRREFLQWVAKRSVTELAIDSKPGVESIGDVLVELYQTTDAT